MKNHKEFKEIRKKVISVTCDRCGKTFTGDDVMELQEMHYIDYRGGYSCVWGDEARVECDLCQHCLKDLIGYFCRVS